MKVQGKVWGASYPLFNKNNVEISAISIKKGGFCSKHLHTTKYNMFVVNKGKLKITIWKDYGSEVLQDVTILGDGMETTVSPGDYHMFEALEDTEALEIYWVELDANDIKRVNHGGVR